MNKQKELMTTKDLVKSILEKDEAARNSDNFLYLRVLGVIAEERNIDIYSLPVSKFFMNLSEWGFPPFETVRRTRQFIQSKFPELSANSAVQVFRAENETVFEDFSRGAV